MPTPTSSTATGFPATVSRESLPRWRALVIRLGYAKSVGLLTGVSILGSVVICLIAFPIFFEQTPREFALGLVLAVAVPAVVAPTVTHTMIGLVLELDRTQTELARMATRDALTGVYNRAHLMERLEAEAGRHFRTGDPLTLLMIDADHFKSINDTYGHATGDLALIAISRACEAELRVSDVFARYGGEEFAVLLPNTSRSEGIAIAERLREAVAKLTVQSTDGRPLELTVSIGVSVLTSPDPGCRRLFDRADTALYSAKRAGRNRCVLAERHAEGVSDGTAAPGPVPAHGDRRLTPVG